MTDGSAYEDYFVEYGILAESHNSRAARAILLLQPSLVDAPYPGAAEYVNNLWLKLEAAGLPSTLNGNAFELVLACVLLKEGITPFYMSAEVQHVPNAHFDILLYTDEIGPIVLSAKTSLRERYKQADLESQALRDVHRRSKTFLVTLGVSEAAIVKRKIEQGEVTNLEDVVVARHSEFDELIAQLRQNTFRVAPNLPVVRSGRLVSL